VNINGRGMRMGTIDRITNDENWYDEWNEPWDNESYQFEKGVEYTMTKSGLEKIKRAEEVDANDASDELGGDHPTEMQKRLKALKEERLRLQKEVEKNAKKTGNIELSDDKSLKKVNKAASKLTDLHWVLDRFYY
jgi:hypothetical protein